MLVPLLPILREQTLRWPQEVLPLVNQKVAACGTCDNYSFGMSEDDHVVPVVMMMMMMDDGG